ncbi:redoxin domain-containing protein [Psychromicrobium xiongbiense]|uniref:redoxin domain-containing protein n=1 Tax=Psychromicrobium xiongbiense TaxID=3051184 RepID=UPI00255750E2|nr:redoxin domain-containing protein [Psychromicrobium sp. YIM S02556]
MTAEALFGRTAPDFSLSNQYGETVSLSALRGTPVFLVFFPFAFSPVCGEELAVLQEHLEEFVAARLLAISADSRYVLKSYAEQQGLSFDLLSDFWPHGDVARQFQALDERRGVPERHTVLIDERGVVAAQFGAAASQPRSWEEYRGLLDAL